MYDVNHNFPPTNIYLVISSLKSKTYIIMIQDPLQVKIITLIIHVSTPRKTPFHVLV